VRKRFLVNIITDEPPGDQYTRDSEAFKSTPYGQKATYNPNYEEKIRLVEDYKNMRFKIMADQKSWLFGFDRTSYSNLKNNGRGRRIRRWRWYEEMREQSKWYRD
jgi:hypothetical protein